MGFLHLWLYQIVSEGCLRSVIPRRTFLFIFLRHTLSVFGEWPVRVKKWIAGNMVSGEVNWCNWFFLPLLLSSLWHLVLCSNHPPPILLKWMYYDDVMIIVKNFPRFQDDIFITVFQWAMWPFNRPIGEQFPQMTSNYTRASRYAPIKCHCGRTWLTTLEVTRKA